MADTVVRTSVSIGPGSETPSVRTSSSRGPVKYTTCVDGTPPMRRIRRNSFRLPRSAADRSSGNGARPAQKRGDDRRRAPGEIDLNWVVITGFEEESARAVARWFPSATRGGRQFRRLTSTSGSSDGFSRNERIRSISTPVFLASSSASSSKIRRAPPRIVSSGERAFHNISSGPSTTRRDSKDPRESVSRCHEIGFSRQINDATLGFTRRSWSSSSRSVSDSRSTDGVFDLRPSSSSHFSRTVLCDTRVIRSSVRRP